MIVRHLPTDTSPVGLLPVGLLPIATFADRDICRSRHLPIATFADWNSAGRDRQMSRPDAVFRRYVIARSKYCLSFLITTNRSACKKGFQGEAMQSHKVERHCLHFLCSGSARTLRGDFVALFMQPSRAKTLTPRVFKSRWSLVVCA